MGRSPCCSKEGMNRGAWTALEDKTLTDYIKTHGEGKWRNIPKQAGLNRCGKSCRLRWLNYLRPDIKRGNISQDEEDLIIRLHKLLGNRWSLIAGRLPGRTDNEIKNYWNTNLAKKAQPPKKQLVETTPDDPKTTAAVRAKASRPQQHKSVTAESGSSDASGDLNLSEEGRFNMDFNMGMGDICLSGILDSDFNKLSEFELGNVMVQGVQQGSNNGCQSDLSPFSDQEVYVSEEMVENWKSCSSSDYVQAGMDSDFRSLASFFDSADEWLGDDDLNVVYPI